MDEYSDQREADVACTTLAKILVMASVATEGLISSGSGRATDVRPLAWKSVVNGFCFGSQESVHEETCIFQYRGVDAFCLCIWFEPP